MDLRTCFLDPCSLALCQSIHKHLRVSRKIPVSRRARHSSQNRPVGAGVPPFLFIGFYMASSRRQVSRTLFSCDIGLKCGNEETRVGAGRFSILSAAILFILASSVAPRTEGYSLRDILSMNQPMEDLEQGPYFHQQFQAQQPVEVYLAEKRAGSQPDVALPKNLQKFLQVPVPLGNRFNVQKVLVSLSSTCATTTSIVLSRATTRIKKCVQQVSEFFL